MTIPIKVILLTIILEVIVCRHLCDLWSRICQLQHTGILVYARLAPKLFFPLKENQVAWKGLSCLHLHSEPAKQTL